MIFSRGDRIGEFIVVLPLGEGNGGEYYRVRSDEGKLCHLSLAAVDKSSAERRVEIARGLHHRNLCRYAGHGTVDVAGGERFYLATEYVSGESLSERLRRVSRPTSSEVRKILRPVLNALAFLHEMTRPVAHNAVDADNILLNLTGNIDDLVLTGMGNARYCGETPDRSFLERSDPFMLSPEALAGKATARNDVFALGAMIYRLLFGMRPWQFSTEGLSYEMIKEQLEYVRREPLKFPLLEGSSPDEDLLRVVTKALAVKPEEGFASAREMLNALDGDIDADIVVNRVENVKVSTKPVKRGGGFDDVAGLDELKDSLTRSVINVLRDPALAKRYQISLPNGMLLYGPPGCGKTFFSQKFAEEVGYNYIYVKSSDLASIYIHGTQEKIGRLFAEAQEKAPTIICFDEFDAFVPNRDNERNTSQSGEVNEFLTQLNNCGERGIFIIASTNRPNLIDRAVLRRGRIDKIVYLPEPDAASRKALFTFYLKDRPCDDSIDYDRLASLTERYVASDISYIAAEAALRAMNDKTDITQRLLEDVIADTGPSVSAGDLRHYRAMKAELENSRDENTRRSVGFKI